MAGLPLLGCMAAGPQANKDSIYLVGPQDGFSPHVGSLLSMMTMMRHWIVEGVKDLSVEELDYQIDDNSNSIGAMLYHLVATERLYQINTFEGIPWGEWDEEINRKWQIPMGLGEEARKEIKGHDIEFYLKKLIEVREATIKGFSERDDDWLMESVSFFDNQPTNNYCKWFHVCEHESNHNGQIKFIKKRINL